MKRFALLCAVAALAACSEAKAPAEEATAPAEEATAVVAEAPYALQAGTYAYTRSDGTSGINTLTADGRFSNAVDGGDVETGTWAQEEGLSCLTPDEGEKRCYTFTQPDADGRFSGTMPDGVTVTVRKTT